MARASYIELDAFLLEGVGSSLREHEWVIQLVVYPDAHCSVPSEVSDIHGCALLDPRGLTEPKYVLPYDVAAFTGLSASSQGVAKKQKLVVSSGEEKAPPGGSGDKVERARVCFANVAHVFGITMSTPYSGKCTNASASGTCPAGTHYTKGAKPSASTVLKAIVGSTNTKYGKELKAGLEKVQT